MCARPAPVVLCGPRTRIALLRLAERIFADTTEPARAATQDIGDWVVDSVTDLFAMAAMFDGASAFDQDLGWCVDDDVWLGSAFRNTLCESTSCGVAGGIYGDCVPSPAPTPPEPGTDAALRGGRVAVALVVGGVLAFLA